MIAMHFVCFIWRLKWIR